jgi:hypothetical protein
MTGARIDSVKRTLAAARPLFCESDTVSLVTFNDNGTTQLARHRLNDDGIEQFYTVVNNLTPSGSTNLSAGIEKLYEIGTDYTMLLLLTDGHINMGVTSVGGLKAMALGVCRSAINTLGYGPDHSRSLLSQLAIASRGSYTYADSDEVLPIIVGDILAGVRGEVFRQVEVSHTGPATVICQEIDSAGSKYTVGNMVADRDYWVVFSATDDLSTIQVSAAGGFSQSVSVTDSDDLAIKEQICRCRVARQLSSISELLETGFAEAVQINTTRTSLTSLRDEITALSDTSSRPLLLRMTGQIAEALEGLESLVAGPGPGSGPALCRMPAGNHLAARMSSGVTCLATQRGYMSGGGDPNETCIFSSPSQRTGSRTVHATYSQVAEPSEPSEPVEPTETLAALLDAMESEPVLPILSPVTTREERTARLLAHAQACASASGSVSEVTATAAAAASGTGDASTMLFDQLRTQASALAAMCSGGMAVRAHVTEGSRSVVIRGSGSGSGSGSSSSSSGSTSPSEAAGAAARQRMRLVASPRVSGL